VNNSCCLSFQSVAFPSAIRRSKA